MICTASWHLVGAAIALDLAAKEAVRLGEESVDLGAGQDQPLPSPSRVTSGTSSDWFETPLPPFLVQQVVVLISWDFVRMKR